MMANGGPGFGAVYWRPDGRWEDQLRVPWGSTFRLRTHFIRSQEDDMIPFVRLPRTTSRSS